MKFVMDLRSKIRAEEVVRKRIDEVGNVGTEGVGTKGPGQGRE